MPTGIKLTNPYGKTKYMIEEILKDLAAADPKFSIIALRYFNPIGNHSSGLLGENPNGIPNNLIPYIMNVYQKKLPELQIYGNDYNTKDGTCLRDFIHVVDLAKGHISAINGLKPGFTAYNLGTGCPTSVLEMVHAFETANNLKINYILSTIDCLIDGPYIDELRDITLPMRGSSNQRVIYLKE